MNFAGKKETDALEEGMRPYAGLHVIVGQQL